MCASCLACRCTAFQIGIFTDHVGPEVILPFGEILAVADRIYKMVDYRIADVTETAKESCRALGVAADLPSAANWAQGRILHAEGFTPYPEGHGKEQLAVSEMRYILIGDEQIDVRGLHDIVTTQQLCTLGFMLRYLEISNGSRPVDLTSVIDALYQKIEAEGVDFVYSSYFTTCKRFLDLPRKCELRAVINRIRKIQYSKV